MRKLLQGLAMVLPLALQAQWDVPTSVQLVGTAPSDRQVIGLAEPITPGAMVSVDAARNSVVSFATVSGGLLLQGNLTPAPSSYAVGMLVTVMPTAVNLPAAQVDLNGLGAKSILKSGGLALDSADLVPGVPARMIYDGQVFHLIGNTYLNCPKGFHIGGREFCIEDSSRADTGWYPANKVCRDMDARLCTFAEWVFACRRDPAFLPTVLDYEWVDSAANNTNGAKRVGNGDDGTGTGEVSIACEHGGQASASTGNQRFRCCRHR